MKITHVITSPRAEGTPRLVLDWLHTDTEHIQDIIFLSKENDELLSEFQRRAHSVRFLAPLPSGLRKVGRLINSIRNACLEDQPDLLICWNTGVSQWVHIGARRAGVKRLLTHAGNPPYGTFTQRYFYSHLTFWIGTILGAKTIVPSDYILRSFHSFRLLSKKHFRRVYNCVDVSKFIKPAQITRGTDVIMVATLEGHKDHPTLLKAWALVEKEISPIKLQIVGKGTKEELLKKMATDLGLRNAVFMGSRNDVPQLLWNSGLFVLSTTEGEGFGTVLIEALAAGLPVVASDVAACREVLGNGQYGMLVTKHSAEALAKGILETVRNPRQNIDERVEYAGGFTPIKMMNQYLEIAAGK